MKTYDMAQISLSADAVMTEYQQKLDDQKTVDFVYEILNTVVNHIDAKGHEYPTMEEIEKNGHCEHNR